MDKNTKTLLENELFYGVKKRERLAWMLAIGGIAIGAIGIAVVALLLPLKEMRAYVAIVDKDTGIAERTVEVTQMNVAQSDAVAQSLLFTYVNDREIYDAADNEVRALRAYNRSSNAIQSYLKDIWNNEQHPDYRPALYGKSAKVTVDVLSISQIGANVAQVRFEKTLSRPGEIPRSGKFYATVSYAFEPETTNTVQSVWRNPFGFKVTDYRITAEQIGDSQ